MAEGFVPHKPNDFLFDHYPLAMQAFCEAELSRLSRRTSEVYDTLRWRWHDRMPIGKSLAGPSHFEWALPDHSVWHRLRMPMRITARRLQNLFYLEQSLADDIEPLLIAGERQPMGRDIWHVAANSEPRSAVILAVTAVEVEAKRLIGAAIPPAEWLVANLPSPPVPILIEQYLPKLLGLEKRWRVPHDMRERLKDAVRLRNDLLHVGSGWASEGPSSDVAAEPVLEVTSDILWMFDLYRGHTWALDMLSDTAKTALRLPTSGAHP